MKIFDFYNKDYNMFQFTICQKPLEDGNLLMIFSLRKEPNEHVNVHRENAYRDQDVLKPYLTQLFGFTEHEKGYSITTMELHHLRLAFEKCKYIVNELSPFIWLKMDTLNKTLEKDLTDLSEAYHQVRDDNGYTRTERQDARKELVTLFGNHTN